MCIYFGSLFVNFLHIFENIFLKRVTLLEKMLPGELFKEENFHHLTTILSLFPDEKFYRSFESWNLNSKV